MISDAACGSIKQSQAYKVLNSKWATGIDELPGQRKPLSQLGR